MVWEIESEMTNTEMLEWVAYFKIKYEAEKKAADDAKAKGGRRR